MRPILQIYQQYKIMPQLQEHQLRVAGVASLICENFNGNISTSDIVTACLLHDMGNIVKFNFDETGKAMLPPEDLEKLPYWEKIKQEFAEKYGGRSHEATKNILKELGIEQRILELVDSVGFRQGQDNSASPDFEKKICAYADMRVGPFGVITLEQRFLDLRERYKNHVEGEKNRNVFEAALREIEKQIFAQCKILPTGVNQESVSKKIEELKNYTI